MNMKLKKHLNMTAIATFLIVVVLSFFAINWLRKDDTLTAEAKSFVGRGIAFGQVLDSNTGEDYSEKIKSGEVLLVYLISGCDACKKEVRLINETNKESKSETKIFGVMFEDDESIKEYVAKHKINFPVLSDQDGKLLKTLNLKYFPSNFKLENGVIEKAAFGAPKNQAELLELTEAK